MWISRAEIVIPTYAKGATTFYPIYFFVNNHFTLPRDNRIISILSTFCGHVRSGAGHRLPGIYLFIIAFDKCLLVSNFLVQKYRLHVLAWDAWFKSLIYFYCHHLEEFRHVCLCSEMSEKLKKRQIFHISRFKTNYNCAFQQISDCRLIFSYETEMEVNEANCVYQHFWTKEKKKKPTRFRREFFVKNKLRKITTVVWAFPKTASAMPRKWTSLNTS